jgi:hypothetical protein
MVQLSQYLIKHHVIKKHGGVEIQLHALTLVIDEMQYNTEELNVSAL